MPRLLRDEQLILPAECQLTYRDSVADMAAVDENSSAQTAWIAIAYGALDVTAHDGFIDGTEILVVPTLPSAPLALHGEGARLWRKLVVGPLNDEELSESEQQIVRDMAEAGIASVNISHDARASTIPRPWLSSPLHELVYALIQSVANEHDIPLIFIKGPALHAQGLREREHSGDVDVWADPSRYKDLASALTAWGWTIARLEFINMTYHSVTAQGSEWGCEVDIHFRFPGIGIDPSSAFCEIRRTGEPRQFAGVNSQVPNRASHAIIYALHLIRPSPGTRVPDRYVQAATDTLRLVGTEAIKSAVSLGSIDVLRELLTRGLPTACIPDEGPGIPADWEWRLAPNRARYHLAVLRSLPWRERPRGLKRILWPSEQATQASATIAGRSERSGTRARLARILDGIRQLIARP